MKNRISRIISILLIACMIPSLGVAAVRAEEELKKEFIFENEPALIRQRFIDFYANDYYDPNNAFINKTIVDSHSCRMTITDVCVNYSGDYIMRIYCANKTYNEDLSFCVNNVCLNRYTTSGTFMDEELQPGEEAIKEVICPRYELDNIGVDVVEEFIAKFAVYANQEGEFIYEERIPIYPGNKSSDEITVPERKVNQWERVVVDDDYCTLIALESKPWPDDSFCVKCFFENKTDEPVMVKLTKVTVNGVDVEDRWYFDMIPGMKEYWTMWFYYKDIKSLSFDYIVTDDFDETEHYDSGSFIVRS